MQSFTMYHFILFIIIPNIVRFQSKTLSLQYKVLMLMFADSRVSKSSRGHEGNDNIMMHL